MPLSQAVVRDWCGMIGCASLDFVRLVEGGGVCWVTWWWVHCRVWGGVCATNWLTSASHTCGRWACVCRMTLGGGGGGRGFCVSELHSSYVCLCRGRLRVVDSAQQAGFSKETTCGLHQKPVHVCQPRASVSFPVIVPLGQANNAAACLCTHKCR